MPRASLFPVHLSASDVLFYEEKRAAKSKPWQKVRSRDCKEEMIDHTESWSKKIMM